MEEPIVYAGVDVSKAQLDYALSHEETARVTVRELNEYLDSA